MTITLEEKKILNKSATECSTCFCRHSYDLWEHKTDVETFSFGELKLLDIQMSCFQVLPSFIWKNNIPAFSAGLYSCILCILGHADNYKASSVLLLENSWARSLSWLPSLADLLSLLYTFSSKSLTLILLKERPVIYIQNCFKS